MGAVVGSVVAAIIAIIVSPSHMDDGLNLLNFGNLKLKRLYCGIGALSVIRTAVRGHGFGIGSIDLVDGATTMTGTGLVTRTRLGIILVSQLLCTIHGTKLISQLSLSFCVCVNINLGLHKRETYEPGRGPI